MLNPTLNSATDIVGEANPAMKSSTPKKRKTPKKPKVESSADKPKSEAKPARKKPSAKKPVVAKGTLYLAKDTYKALIDGLRSQGLEHDDAVETLKVGLREANGIPVPQALRHSATTVNMAEAESANDSVAAEAV